MQTIHDLMAAVAAHLVGEPVAITYNQPEDNRLLAHVQRNVKGVPVININPSMTGNHEQDLHVFLHEIAHHRLTKYKPSPIEARPTMPNHGNGIWRERYNRDEDNAEAMADQLESWAKRNASESLPFLEGCLMALLEYPANKRGTK